MARQYAEAEAELVNRRRQLSEQEGRAADLERQYTEAEAELVERRRQLFKQERRAAHLERSTGARVRLALVPVKLALKNLRANLRTGRAFGWQREDQTVKLRRVREAVFDIAAVLRNLEDERARQASRVERTTCLIAQQETVVAEMGEEIAQQRDRIEELMREPVRE